MICSYTKLYLEETSSIKQAHIEDQKSIITPNAVNYKFHPKTSWHDRWKMFS